MVNRLLGALLAIVAFSLFIASIIVLAFGRTLSGVLLFFAALVCSVVALFLERIMACPVPNQETSDLFMPEN